MSQSDAPPNAGCLTAITTVFGGAFAFAGAAILIHLALHGPGFRLAGHSHRHDRGNPVIDTVAGLIFLAIGGGTIAAGFVAASMARYQERQMARFPEQPWKWKRHWAQGRIRDLSAANTSVAWLLTLIFDGILIPSSYAGWDQYSRTHQAALLPLIVLLLAVALWIALRAIRITLRELKYGTSVFTMQTFPAIPGSAMLGTIHVNRQLDVATSVSLQLICIHRRQSRNNAPGNQMANGTEELWRFEQTLDRVASSATGAEIPVRFEVPAKVASSADGTYSQIIWQLKADAAASGVSYSTQFEVPVFHTVAAKPIDSAKPPSE